ncbi:MAG: AAA family ATPase [Propionibacteriaceae bacterium]
MLTTLAIHGYRSLRDLVLPLGNITVVTGTNGSGKSNLYRALRLLVDVTDGKIIRSLAYAGGLESVLWAGPEQISGAMKRGDVAIQGTARRSPVSLQLGFASNDLGYLVDIGLPTPGALFQHDPQIKREKIFAGPYMRPATTLVSRPRNLDTRSSLLEDLAGHDDYPEVATMRRVLGSWRFHDVMRADPTAPARQYQVLTWTPTLGDDGSDLAAALATIQDSMWADLLTEAISDAFPGCQLQIIHTGKEIISTGIGGITALKQPGMLRPLTAAELSDGTLRYLMLIAALLSPTPPPLLVLNEPETSLHPELLAPLGRLIKRASERSQIMVVTHAVPLATALTEHSESKHLHLTKEFGETKLVGQGLLDRPSWQWGQR